MLILRGILEITATFRLHKEATLKTERAAILKPTRLPTIRFGKMEHISQHYMRACELPELRRGVWVPAISSRKLLSPT